MKIGNFVKNLTVAVLLATSILNLTAMEKEQKKWAIDDIKGKYLVIVGGGAPAWVRIKNGNGETFYEKDKKDPIRPPVERVTYNLYKNSDIDNRVLVSGLEPLIIWYDEIQYPLEIKVWSYKNFNDPNDSSSQATYHIEEQDIAKALGTLDASNNIVEVIVGTVPVNEKKVWVYGDRRLPLIEIKNAKELSTAIR